MTAYIERFNRGENPFETEYKIKWVRKNGKRKKVKQKISVSYHDFLVQEWQLFIRGIHKDTPPSRLKELDQQFHFSKSGNSEILCDWFVLAAQSKYAFEIEADIQSFLTKIGRRKYVLPIYETLAKSPAGLKLAQRIFHGAKENYHSVTRGSVWKVLKP